MTETEPTEERSTKWFDKAGLNELRKKWTSLEHERIRNLDHVPVGAGVSAESLDAVHAALLALEPKYVSIPGSASLMPHITAAKTKDVVRQLTTDIDNHKKNIRTRYLYWLLVQLNGEERLTFRLPVASVERPPRALAFDPLNPYLPSVTRFRSWQRRLTDLALDVRAPRSLEYTQILDAEREGEFRALATLLAYGGVCGRTALETAARLTVTDVSEDMTSLTLRDEAGYRIFSLTLHPIQTLTLMRLMRRSQSSDAVDGTENHGTSLNVFPSLASSRGKRSFLDWLAIVLERIDDEVKPTIRVTSRKYTARPGIGALLAGAHRFMLDIYPVYLVSVLTGKFRPARIIEGNQEQRGTAVAEIEPQCPATEEEMNVRGKLRAAIREHLLRRKRSGPRTPPRGKLRHRRRGNSYHVDGINSRPLQQSWSEFRVQAPLELPAEGESECGRRWNLTLLIRSLEWMLVKDRVKSGNTFKNLFDGGCSLLDALDGKPVWMLTSFDVDDLLPRMKPGFLPKVLPHLHRMLDEAFRMSTHLSTASDAKGETPSETAYVELADLIEYTREEIPHLLPSEQAARMTGSRPRDVPTAEQCERITRMIRKEMRASTGAWRELLRDARVYVSLLALGLRRGEAAAVVARDVDRLDHARLPRMTDLYVHEGKTKAARRIVPLELHPHKLCARIIIAQARLLYNADADKEAQLINSSGVHARDYELNEPRSKKVSSRRKGTRRVYGRKRKGSTGKRSLDQLDRVIRKFGARCGKIKLTPHELRHASITSSLSAPGAVPELVAKSHGHSDLPTSFQHYAHELSQTQARELSIFLRPNENRVWIAVTDAAALIGSPRQTVYEAFEGDDENIGDVETARLPGLVIGRGGRRQRVDAAALVSYYSTKRPRTRKAKSGVDQRLQSYRKA